MDGELIRMDEKGRVLIPLKIRKRLGMKNLVRVRVEGKKVVLEPVPDPLDIVKGLVVKGTEDVEKEIRDLRKIAEKELSKEAERE
ncbi:MAG: AbrB/MazE/SpoVT family DNA-binding domain-containing protein [Thaumarchaeota archaeon]|nr:MAG: AbrB/MazE/SpoVT family DNA-binding domain-containing protein [Nitrososphaerota archaeon]